MKKSKLLIVGLIALLMAGGLVLAGCGGDGGGEEDNTPPYVPPTIDSLTGTITVTKDVTVDFSGEKMTLTADTSGLNGNSLYYSHQWMRDGSNISGATRNTYDVTAADYGKTLKVKVTSSVLSGEQTGEIAVPNPTTLSLTLKWNASAGKKDTGIIIEKGNGSHWKSTTGNLTTTGTTITLTSWIEEKFKIRTEYTFIETKFYFEKDNALGSDLFDFTGGTKTYTLTNVADGFGLQKLRVLCVRGFYSLS